MKRFNKTLTSKKMMQADIMPELNERNTRDLVAECFEHRVQGITKKEERNKKKWEKVLCTDKNYISNKRGFKFMLDDLEIAKKNISKFKRGLSVFDDQKMKEKLLSSTNAPVISDQKLIGNLKHVVLSY